LFSFCFSLFVSFDFKMCFKIPAPIYIVLNTLLSSIISGIIEAGIAVGLYQNTYRKVRIFAWPDTLAGNILITTLLQCAVTWFLCHSLIRQGQRANILGIGRFHRPSCLDSTFSRVFFQSEDILQCPPKKGILHLLLSFIKSWARGLIFGFLMVFVIGWPTTLIIFGIEESHITHYRLWWLVIIMGIYGFCLSLVTTPIITYLALASPEDDKYEEKGSKR